MEAAIERCTYRGDQTKKESGAPGTPEHRCNPEGGRVLVSERVSDGLVMIQDEEQIVPFNPVGHRKRNYTPCAGKNEVFKGCARQILGSPVSLYLTMN